MREFKPRNTRRARQLRRHAPPAERTLWRYLSGAQLGVRFSRQMPVGPYFADFLCRELRLVIELDGYSHETQQGYDAARDRFMDVEGYRVLRFANRDVVEKLDGVLTIIRLAVEAGRKPAHPLPPPLPLAGGE